MKLNWIRKYEGDSPISGIVFGGAYARCYWKRKEWPKGQFYYQAWVGTRTESFDTYQEAEAWCEARVRGWW